MNGKTWKIKITGMFSNLTSTADNVIDEGNVGNIGRQLRIVATIKHELQALQFVLTKEKELFFIFLCLNNIRIQKEN